MVKGIKPNAGVDESPGFLAKSNVGCVQARAFIYPPTGKGILAALANAANHDFGTLAHIVSDAGIECDEYSQLRGFLLQVSLSAYDMSVSDDNCLVAALC